MSDPNITEQSQGAGGGSSAPTLLGAVNQAIKDFDMEAWKEQDSSCLLCHAAMGLEFGCEWPDDPCLLLCWDCMSKLCAELLAMVQAPNAGDEPPRI